MLLINDSYMGVANSGLERLASVLTGRLHLGFSRG